MSFSLQSVEKDHKFRGLIIGENGRGKTICAGSYPGKTLIFDFDKRYEPLIDWYPEKLADIEIEVITPSNYMTVFQDRVNKLMIHNPYDNIVIDGITGLSNTTIMMQMMAKGQAATNDKELKIKVTKTGIPIPSWDEFNGETMVITQLLECLKSLNCNLIVTAHPIQRTDMKDGKYASIVAFGTKVGSMIPGYFNEVYYLDYTFDLSGKLRRILTTQPDSTYPSAKSSIKNLPAKLDITDKKMYDVIKEYL